MIYSKISLMLFIAILFVGCISYSNNHMNIPKEWNDYYLYKDEVISDTIKLKLPGDYGFEADKKEYIYFKNRQITKLLRQNINQKPTEQFLFCYTYMPIYINLLGFYYENLSLSEVEKSYFGIPNFENKNNGIVYYYNFEEFQVMDAYKKWGKGTLRFLSVDNPKSNNKYELETGTFFYYNNHLWE